MTDLGSRSAFSSTQQKGLSFCGLGIGIIIGSLCHPIWQRYYQRITDETGKRPPPEEHLRKGLYGVVLVPVSLFWFAFTTYPSIHWSVSQVRSPVSLSPYSASLTLFHLTRLAFLSYFLHRSRLFRSALV